MNFWGDKKLAKSIFNKNIPRCCEYCTNALISSALNLVFCKYKGPVSPSDVCIKYKYDPLKRTPHTSAKLPKFSPEDFSL